MRSNAKDGKVIFSVVSRISQTCDVLVKGLAEDAFTGIFSGAKSADVAQLVEQLIRNSRESFCVDFRSAAQPLFRPGLRQRDSQDVSPSCAVLQQEIREP